jgi:hypothetical protein
VPVAVGDDEAAAALDEDVAVVAHAQQQRLACVGASRAQAGERQTGAAPVWGA